MPTFLRRNEVLVPVRRAEAASVGDAGVLRGEPAARVMPKPVA